MNPNPEALEDTPEKVARFNKEIQIFERRWPDIMRTEIPIIIRI